MGIDREFIFEFLGEVEGRAYTTGYVPTYSNGVVAGVSGVTIGTGVDLGQQDREGLLRMGVPGPIVSRLERYLGLRKDAAVEALKNSKLTLTPEEVKALDTAVFGQYLKGIEKLYNGGRPVKPFADLPREAQAAMLSLYYQRGEGYIRKATELWQYFLNGEWGKAADWLCNPDNAGDYFHRREREGNLVRSIPQEPPQVQPVERTWLDELYSRASGKTDIPRDMDTSKPLPPVTAPSPPEKASTNFSPFPRQKTALGPRQFPTLLG